MSNPKLLSTVSFAAFVFAMPALAADVLTEEQFEERFSGAAVSALNAKIEVGKFHVGFDDNDNFGPLALEDSYRVLCAGCGFCAFDGPVWHSD